MIIAFLFQGIYALTLSKSAECIHEKMQLHFNEMLWTAECHLPWQQIRLFQVLC